MKRLNLTLFVWVSVQPLAVFLSAPQIALADTPASTCVNGLLYRSSTFGTTRTSLSEQLAATVCKGVTTQQESDSVRSCVVSLLFTTSTFETRRTQTSEDTALSTCSISRNVPQNPPPYGYPPSYGYPVPIGGSPQAISACMRKLLYEQRLVCTRDRCSSIPSEGFGGWQTQPVRTEFSESAAAQACQGAR